MKRQDVLYVFQVALGVFTSVFLVALYARPLTVARSDPHPIPQTSVFVLPCKVLDPWKETKPPL
jgi:hypothetical protein